MYIGNESRFFKVLKENNIATISYIIMMIILISLGFWQVARLNQKNDMIFNIKKNLNLESQFINKLDKISSYDKIKLSGNFLPNKYLWLYRRHPQAKYLDGAYLLMPFKLLNDQVILVAIGWFEQSMKDEAIRHINKINDIRAIEGVALDSERQSFFIPGNDYKNKIIFTVDVKEISEKFNLDLFDKFLANTSDFIGDFKYFKISTHMMFKVTNDHLEYALTWFSLAGVLTLVYMLYIRKKMI